MFDGPPVVVSYPSNQSNDTTPIQVLEPQNISWVDVVNASESIAPDRVIDMQDPHDQAKRVVRFEVKGCEVQVGWEEWQMMRSGMAKNMLPSQPAPEDEDKELATLDILEELVGKVVGLADQVAARGRQFNHRLRARKVALADRTSKRTLTVSQSAKPSALGVGCFGILVIRSYTGQIGFGPLRPADFLLHRQTTRIQ